MSFRVSVLLVDSNRQRLDAMTRFFLRLGYRVTPVSHPRQALEACSFRHFNAAVLSDSLPEIQTSDLAARLRRHITGLRPIVVSGDVSTWSELEDDLAAAVDRGFDEFDQLLQSVNEDADLVGSTG